MARVRDTQRSRLYHAEEVAWFRCTGNHDYVQTIGNGDLQCWVDAVLRRRAIKTRWPFARIAVILGRGAASAQLNDITLGVKTRNEWVILHEVAHCLTPREYADHGPEFAGVLLFLVKTVLGKPAYDVLLEEFRNKRVRRCNAAVPLPLKIKTPRRVGSAKAEAAA